MTTCLHMRRMNIEKVPRPFGTTLEQRGNTMIVAPAGEIDMSCSEKLRSQLLGLRASFRRLVLDLREVPFMDSSGLHCIFDVDSACRAGGVEFLLVRGPGQVQRLFDVTRMEERLRFVDDVEAL